MTWSDWALDLLFPPKCPYCQGLLEGSYVPACTRCQPVLPWLVGTQGERKVDFTAGCLSPLAYRDKVVDSIHRFKFSGRASYARAYAIAEDGTVIYDLGVDGLRQRLSFTPD